MSQSTTPNAEPRLCKMGCGFFGSGATEDCCSKCFLENQKKQTECVAIKPPSPEQQPVETTPALEEAVSPEPMMIDPPVTEEKAEEQMPVVNKKKKKASYKSMMAAMTKPTGLRDAEKEKESIRKATGGGAFSKIDKI